MLDSFIDFSYKNGDIIQKDLIKSRIMFSCYNHFTCYAPNDFKNHLEPISKNLHLLNNEQLLHFFKKIAKYNITKLKNNHDFLNDLIKKFNYLKQYNTISNETDFFNVLFENFTQDIKN